MLALFWYDFHILGLFQIFKLFCLSARPGCATRAASSVLRQTRVPVSQATLVATAFRPSVFRNAQMAVCVHIQTLASVLMAGSMPIVPHLCALKPAAMAATALGLTPALALRCGGALIAANPYALRHVSTAVSA